MRAADGSYKNESYKNGIRKQMMVENWGMF